jgi:hypothetical protein
MAKPIGRIYNHGINILYYINTIGEIMIKNKKRQFNVILVLSAILLIETVSYLQKEATSSTFSVNSITRSEITDELVIALFMENIVVDSNAFYAADYFTNELEYFNLDYSSSYSRQC